MTLWRSLGAHDQKRGTRARCQRGGTVKWACGGRSDRGASARGRCWGGGGGRAIGCFGPPMEIGLEACGPAVLMSASDPKRTSATRRQHGMFAHGYRASLAPVDRSSHVGHCDDLMDLVLAASCESGAQDRCVRRRLRLSSVRCLSRALGSGSDGHRVFPMHLAQVSGRCFQCCRHTGCILGKRDPALVSCSPVSGRFHAWSLKDAGPERQPRITSASGR